MKTLFQNAADRILNPALQAWIDGGKPVVGYTCSFLPPEILHAVDMLPYRLRGIETQSMEIGDAYYGPYICTFPKCLLQLVGEGRFNFMKGAVISTGCDAMRRLDECWRKAGEDHPGVTPPFFHYFDVPHKADPHAMSWFIDEIRRFIDALEKHFQVRVTDDRLRDAIAVYNEGRRLLAEMETLRIERPPRISGADAFAVQIAGTVMPRPDFNAALASLLNDLRSAGPSADGRKRILVTGSISDDLDLIRLIEECGAAVVSENICFGIRNEADRIPVDGDPVENLARRYLSNSVCPRMFGEYRLRFNYLKQKVEKTGVEGMILQNVRFCDLHGSENGLFERDFEAMGIPCLRLEREYGPLTETGRMRMRIDAFLERLA